MGRLEVGGLQRVQGSSPGIPGGLSENLETCCQLVLTRRSPGGGGSLRRCLGRSWTWEPFVGRVGQWWGTAMAGSLSLDHEEFPGSGGPLLTQLATGSPRQEGLQRLEPAMLFPGPWHVLTICSVSSLNPALPPPRPPMLVYDSALPASQACPSVGTRLLVWWKSWAGGEN